MTIRALAQAEGRSDTALVRYLIFHLCMKGSGDGILQYNWTTSVVSISLSYITAGTRQKEFRCSLSHGLELILYSLNNVIQKRYSYVQSSIVSASALGRCLCLAQLLGWEGSCGHPLTLLIYLVKVFVNIFPHLTVKYFDFINLLISINNIHGWTLQFDSDAR